MKDQSMSAARTVGRAVAAIAIVTVATFAVASHCLAQQPTPQPKSAQPKQAPKQQPKQQPAQPADSQPGQGQVAGSPDQPSVAYSPWIKVCAKPDESSPKRICFTGRDGRAEAGMLLVAAVVMQPEGETMKILRVTLPLGMSLQPGTRVIVDQGEPISGPYGICFENGCMADFEINDDLITRMKKGQRLVVQGVNGAGEVISQVVPLADFAKIYDGPPADAKTIEELQKKY